jgi:large subunit ribosomal protein L24
VPLEVRARAVHIEVVANETDDHLVRLRAADDGLDAIRVLPDERVLVENVNMVKKHQKPNPARGVTGAIVQKEAPIHASNVSLWNPATKKADRVGFRTLEDGRKVRFFKSNGEVVDV